MLKFAIKLVFMGLNSFAGRTSFIVSTGLPKKPSDGF